MISITTSVAFTSLWLIPRLAKFRARHPGLDVRISATNEIVDLEREQLDLAIRYCHPQQAPQAAIKLFADEAFPVCSKALVAAAAKPLNNPPISRTTCCLNSTMKSTARGSFGRHGSIR